jgi:hypothetical protein
MAVFFQGRTAVDDRNLVTDHLVQTIVQFFDAQSAPESKAGSLLDSGESSFTASITLSSDVTREWYLILYRADQKYVFNIHQKSTGDARKFRLQPGRFDPMLLDEGKILIVEASPYLKQAFSDFGIQSSKVHASYRNLFH